MAFPAAPPTPFAPAAGLAGPAGPVANVLQPQPLELDEQGEAELREVVHRELQAAVEAHAQRQKFLARLLKAYKALPEYEVKNFPWPNASNIVVPIVAISVDTVAARLQRAVLGAKDPVEAHVQTKTPYIIQVPPAPEEGVQGGAQELDDKLLRDWCAWFLRESGGRDRLRTVFADMPLYGDAFASLNWVEEERVYHAYDDTGAVVELKVPAYTGVRWSVAAPSDVFWPTGYDEWQQLPWFALRLRYSLPELMDLVEKGVFQREDVDQLKPSMREDARRLTSKRSEHVTDMPQEPYTLYEIRGRFEIPPAEGQTTDGAVPVFEEVVLTYSLDKNIFLRKIYNPYFGKARHFVKVPYLVQPHELVGMGVAEMSIPFQEEATTSHNQVIDAATAANAGITVLSSNVQIGPNEEIYPGKTVVTDGSAKDDINIVHLSEPSQVLGAVEEKAFFMNEKRTGVSVYNLGMESPTVGSRATATGTTALINEGNQRFWVSIDDMRSAIEELLYLTIQLEQQMRPEGFFFERGRYIQFPPGDPRQSIALRLNVSSESVNRDIEVQQMQLLMQVVNDYYMRLNQAMMLIANPQFPPQAKLMAAQTMEASSRLVKKFVERFDVEDLDAVVPSVVQTLQMMSQMMSMAGGQGGQPTVAAAPTGGPAAPTQGIRGGPPQAFGPPQGGGRPF